MAAKMFSKMAVALLLSVLTASANDIRSGITDSRQHLVFEQKYDYNPSIYTRSETVNVETHGNEVISMIEVLDERELKDGQATIISGGVGQRFVTIQLSGPAVFRGMTFLVRVYGMDSNNFYNQRNSGVGNRQLGEYNAGYPTKTGSYVYDTQQVYHDNQRYIKQ